MVSGIQKKRKNVRMFGAYVLIFLFCIMCTGMEVRAEGTFEIEQIQECMPEISLYLRSDSLPETENLEVWLGEELLSIENVTSFAETGEHICYFVLIDISASMPNRYFEAEKKALDIFVDELGENSLTLISFGDEVTVEFSGASENAEDAKTAIAGLENNDHETHLFEAIKRTADLADAVTDGSRKVVLVISDGEDFATGRTTKDEMQQELGIRNIPVYAFGIRDTATENLNSFGEMARSLGGELYIFEPEELETCFNEWMMSLQNTWKLTCYASNNRIDHQTHNCVISIPSQSISRSREILLSCSTPDTEAPYIEEIWKSAEDETALYIRFSERVVGADSTDRFHVSREGKSLNIVHASYADENDTVLLRTDEQLYAGEYVIEIDGITDDSMEQNQVIQSYSVVLDGEEAPIETEELSKTDKEDFMGRYWWLLLMILVLAVLIILVIIIIWHRIKKNRGIVYVDGKATLVKNVEEKQHIHVETNEGLPVRFELLNASGAETKKIEFHLYDSMMVGRAGYCDLSFDDSGLSKQHFALEYENEMMYITDLQTTNGTKVNGVAIHGRHRLESRDRVEAGNLIIRIQW